MYQIRLEQGLTKLFHLTYPFSEGNLSYIMEVSYISLSQLVRGNWLPGAFRVPGNILAPIPRAWEPQSGKKSFLVFFRS